MQEENCDLIIYGGTIVTQNPSREVIPDGALVILKDKIIAVSKTETVMRHYLSKRFINATGQYIFPGLINTHTHLFQTFIKGLGEGLSLYKWVDTIAAPSASGMDKEQGYLSALLGGLEAIRCGTTTILDFMYSMPTSGLYYQIGQGFRDIGLRGVMGLGLMENGEEHGLSPCQFRSVPEALNEWDEITSEFAGDLISFALAPEIPFGISYKGYQQIRQYASDHQMPITIHINEGYADDKATLADYGMRAVPFLEEIDFWGPDVIGVHCVKMQPEDIEIFSNHDVKISHNPVSNMYLGVGRAPIIALQKAGLTTSLATDGAGSNNSQDMIEVMKCTGLLQRVGHENPEIIRSQTILDMATLGGARAIGQEERIGSLEIGKQADLFIFDPLKPKSTPIFDPVSNLVFSSSSENIITTIVAGKILMLDGIIKTVDEMTVLKKCQESAWKLARHVGYAA